jgi:ribosome-binding protein aMBF1 (putative translation factor)
MLEVIYKTGVSNICVNCYPKYRLPIIEKKRVDWSSVDDNRRPSVRERLSNMAHVDVRESSRGPVEKVKNPEDMTLRDIVEKNFKKDQYSKENLPSELIDNFNWVIMRRRRAMKLSHVQLAEKIHEPEVIVTSLEKGILPKEYYSLLKKVESVLGIRLFKDLTRDIGPEDIVAESKVPTGLLLSEVKEKSGAFKNWFKRKKEPTQDEILEVMKEAGVEETFDVENMNLDSVNEFVGVPVEEDRATKYESSRLSEARREIPSKKEEVEKKETLEEKKPYSDEDQDMSAEDIADLIWRN